MSLKLKTERSYQEPFLEVSKTPSLLPHGWWAVRGSNPGPTD
jgi:hypothetical protein